MEIVDYQAEQIIKKELGQDEKLLWSGRPQKGILFRKSDIVLIPLTLVWTGFALFCEALVIRAGAPILFQLFGFPFILVGLQMTFGRFLLNARIRAATFYGVTSQRIVIISGLRKRKIQSCDLKSLRGLNLLESDRNRGTVSFGAENPHWSWLQDAPFGQTIMPQFEMIENPRIVFQLIQKAKEAMTL